MDTPVCVSPHSVSESEQCALCPCPCIKSMALWQGDKEKELGLAVSPLMDRTHKGGITRSQVRFFFYLTDPTVSLELFACFHQQSQRYVS